MNTFRFYLDESGKEPRSKYVVMAGFGAEAGAWGALESEWRRALRTSPSIEYFKMHEATKLKGQFDRSKGWTESMVAEKVDALTGILARRAAVYTLVRCHKLQFKVACAETHHLKIPKKFNYPYLACFWESMLIAGSYMDKHRKREPKPAVVLDAQPEHEIEAHALFAALKAMGKDRSCLIRKRARWLSGISFEDDKITLPLQAADVIAWHSNRLHKDVWDQRDLEPFIAQINKNRCLVASWSIERLISWRQALPQILGLP